MEQLKFNSRFNPLFIRSVFLFNFFSSHIQFFFWWSFNPLFIRSVFLLQNKKYMLILIYCFNPLFIRSVFLLYTIPRNHANTVMDVSIPYSSGQCFFLIDSGYFSKNLYLFQSLIHQVSVSFMKQKRMLFSSWIGFNPLFIRSVFLFLLRKLYGYGVWIRFQSLIHQVSVSFKLLNWNQHLSSF